MDEARTRLRAAMAARRRELRATWRELAHHAGMTEQNLLRIRTGEISVSEGAMDGIDIAFQWAAGSVEAVLNGGDPIRLEDQVADEDEDEALFLAIAGRRGPEWAAKRLGWVPGPDALEESAGVEADQEDDDDEESGA